MLYDENDFIVIKKDGPVVRWISHLEEIRRDIFYEFLYPVKEILNDNSLNETEKVQKISEMSNCIFKLIEEREFELN